MATTTSKTKTTRSIASEQSTERHSEAVPAAIWRHVAHPHAGTIRALYRHMLLPWYWAAGVVTAVATSVLMAQEATHPAARVATTLVVITAGVVAIWAVPYWLRATTRPRWATEAQWARTNPGHTVLTAAVAGAWASLVVLSWPTTGQGWALALACAVLATIGLGARYWQHHRHHTRVVNPHHPEAASHLVASLGSEEQAAEDAGPMDLCQRIQARWASKVEPDGGVLPGAKLTLRPTASGAQGQVRLVGGRQDLSTMDSVRGKLASALGVQSGLISYSEHDPDQGEPDPALLDIAIMSATVRNRLYPLTEHQRVNRRGAMTTLTVGGIVDGSAMAEYLLYDESGIRNGYATGATGAGKSVLVDALVIGGLETATTAILYIDPKGNSSPKLRKHAHLAVASDDPRRWERIITGVLEGMSARKAMVASGELDSSEFHPTPEFPGILLVIDEVHQLTAIPELRDSLGTIAREGRSLGFGMIFASQGYTAKTWGGSTDLRRDVTQANAFALKLDKDHGNSFAADFGINPKTLPDPTRIKARADGSTFKPNAGFALSKAVGSTPVRTLFAEETVREQLMASARARAVPAIDVATFGAIDAGSEHMLSRADEEREEMRAAAAGRLEHYRQLGRAALGGHTPPPSPAPASTRPHGGGPGRATAAGRRPAAPVIDLDVLRGIRHQETAEAGTTSAAEAGIREVLAAGLATKGQIIEELAGRPGCGSTRVREEMDRLHQDGVIERTGHSQKAPWRLAAH